MRKKHKKTIVLLLVFLLFCGLLAVFFTFFFDHAVLTRQNTFYRAWGPEKVVALTFDDGPSPIWTPAVLNALKKSGVKATFFMLGRHVEQYPDTARRVTGEGHDVGIHSYHHDNFIFSDKYQVAQDIGRTQQVIKETTGKTTKLFRPPKAWLSKREKKKIKELGYTVVLWSLNSKDWVNFDDKYIVRYLAENIHPGAIILFHDSGGFFKVEEGNRVETVNAIPKLVEKLKDKGYRFVTVSEMLEIEKEYEAGK
ncbi:MAG: polysaccharide deacetylase family protein [Candidatus Omnitrophota bacterium]